MPRRRAASTGVGRLSSPERLTAAFDRGNVIPRHAHLHRSNGNLEDVSFQLPHHPAALP